MPVRDEQMADQELPSIIMDSDDLDRGYTSRGATKSKAEKVRAHNGSTPVDSDSIPERRPSEVDAMTVTLPQGGAGPVVMGVFATLFLILAGASTWLFLELQGSQESLRASQERLATLETRLSSTDETVNQSSVELQVRLRDLTEHVGKMQTQLDRSLATSVRQNQNDITALSASLKKQDDILKKQGELIKTQDSQVEASKSQLEGLKKQVAESAKAMDAMEKALSAQAKELDAVAETAKKGVVAHDKLEAVAEANTSVQDSLKKLQGNYAEVVRRLDSNEEWVASINTSRRQVNEQVKQLQEALRALQNKGGSEGFQTVPQ